MTDEQIALARKVDLLSYDPLAKADPDTTLTADERDIGGLGVFMVKKMMDSVEYRYEDNKNILRIEKNLTQGSENK